jgi:hypothetical protein
MKLEAKQIPPVIGVLGPATLHNALSVSASVLALTMSLLLGCGFSLNPSAASTGGQTDSGSGSTGGTGAPVGPVGAGGQAIPLPAAFHALTGCTNPNTGVATSDWGVGTNPVYTLIDNQTPVVGMPIYTSNAVFWTSRENAPGQSILLTGAFTDASKTARLALIPPGTIDWQTLVRESTTVIPTTQQGTTGLSFIVPSSFPAGVYGFEIDDPTAPPVLGLAN